jgi:hypothetical protein
MYGFNALHRVGSTNKRGGDERRRGGRIPCRDLTCEFGPVIDLSPGGMRIRSRKHLALEPDKPTKVTLRSVVGYLTVEALPLRTIKTDGGHETSFRFVNAEGLEQAIRHLALACTADGL